MARNFKELETRMGPARRKRIRLRTKEALAELLLSQIRKEAGLTQEELARTLGIRQPSLSQLEAQDDMQISTLRRIIQALGGELELIAHLPTGDIRLSQFSSETAETGR